MEITFGCLQGLMSQKFLDLSNIHSPLEKMGGKAMTKGMKRDAFLDADRLLGPLEDALEAVTIEALVGQRILEEPAPGTALLPVHTQRLKKLLGEHHVAIFHSLALLDADDHAFAVDVADTKTSDFPEAKARGVYDQEHHSVLEVLHSLENENNLLQAENLG
jgi:hypothetical protein